MLSYPVIKDVNKSEIGKAHTLSVTKRVAARVKKMHGVVVQVLRYIAERMHLRHPNLVTVMGVSAEPITEDPLLVPAPGPCFACFASCPEFVSGLPVFS